MVAFTLACLQLHVAFTWACLQLQVAFTLAYVQLLVAFTWVLLADSFHSCLVDCNILIKCRSFRLQDDAPIDVSSYSAVVLPMLPFITAIAHKGFLTGVNLFFACDTQM